MLNYIQESKISNVTNDATREVHECVSRVRVSPEVRLEYMTWEEKIFYERLDAKDEGKIESILELLEDFGTVPEEIVDRLKNETDLDKIKAWNKLAARADSIQEFVEHM